MQQTRMFFFSLSSTRWINGKVQKICQFFDVLRSRGAAANIIEIRDNLQLQGDFEIIEFLHQQVSQTDYHIGEKDPW